MSQAELSQYHDLLTEIKGRVRHAQHRAVLSANAEMTRMYWDIGRMISKRQKLEGWGAAVIPRLAVDLKNDLPEQKGFSERNLGYMVRFSREYGEPPILQQAAANSHNPILEHTLQGVADPANESSEAILQPDAANLPLPRSAGTVDSLLAIPWFHNVVLMQKVKDLPTRFWYARQTLEQGWSRETLTAQIKSEAHLRQGTAISNFAETLPGVHADLATEMLKDPYIFDFLTLEEPFHERELETGLLTHIERFLLELGHGFAFVGRQYRLTVSDHDFYLDLLFYHLKLECFVVVDLKKGEFKPEYAGKMNFYCSVVDDQLRRQHDKPTLGLILCQTKDRIIAEYSLRDIEKPIGVADYELTRALPQELASSLPSIEAIEAELSQELTEEKE
jgi:predicted nuclease of restriction endonuclease-like (RecB) superfamily